MEKLMQGQSTWTFVKTVKLRFITNNISILVSSSENIAYKIS